MVQSTDGIVARDLHRRGVVRVADTAAPVDEYHARFRTGRVDHFGDCFARDCIRRAVTERQHSFAAQRSQDDRLALPRCRRGPECVRESAGANQRGVTHASEKFAGHAAGRGRSRDSAAHVDGDRAYRAVAVSHRGARGGFRLEHAGLLLSRAPSLARSLGNHFLGPHEPDTDFAREAFRSRRRHQDVRRMLHHGARQHDWISHAADHCDRAGRHGVIGSIGVIGTMRAFASRGGLRFGWSGNRLGEHHRRIHLDVALGVQQRAVAGVEKRMILERDHCGDDGFERAAVGAEDSRAEAHRRHHRAAALRTLGARARIAGAAMRDERGMIARARHLKARGGGPR